MSSDMFDLDRAGGGVDLDAVNGSAAVRSGIVDVSLSIEVRGSIGPGALHELHRLLADLAPTRNTITIDLYEAECDTGALMEMLDDFRARRLRAGHGCRLRGLHSGVIPDPEAIDLRDLFVAYREALRFDDAAD